MCRVCRKCMRGGVCASRDAPCSMGCSTGDAHRLEWGRVGKPQRNPLILSAQVPGARPGSVCVTMIKHQWLLLRREEGKGEVCVQHGMVQAGSAGREAGRPRRQAAQAGRAGRPRSSSSASRESLREIR